ncbi:MAG: type II toxin-antitoxin system HicA family toxin [Nitrospiraceae bacterium]|nr:type II toxin-antitoxin system HicA family toxin [Nitrospiraceae bacterium]
MPKVPPLNADKLIKILLKHGFVLDHQTGSHRVYINKKMGKRVIVPYHRKDLPKGTLMAIVKASGIDGLFD